MRVLCVCEHGNIRSVALAYLIKTIYKHEVIAAGYKNLSEESLQGLMQWADVTLALNNEGYEKLREIGAKVQPPLDKHTKLLGLLDVGEDIWHDPFAQALQHKLLKNLKGLNL